MKQMPELEGAREIGDLHVSSPETEYTEERHEGSLQTTLNPLEVKEGYSLSFVTARRKGIIGDDVYTQNTFLINLKTGKIKVKTVHYPISSIQLKPEAKTYEPSFDPAADDDWSVHFQEAPFEYNIPLTEHYSLYPKGTKYELRTNGGIVKELVIKEPYADQYSAGVVEQRYKGVLRNMNHPEALKAGYTLRFSTYLTASKPGAWIYTQYHFLINPETGDIRKIIHKTPNNRIHEFQLQGLKISESKMYNLSKLKENNYVYPNGSIVGFLNERKTLSIRVPNKASPREFTYSKTRTLPQMVLRRPG